MDHYQSKLNYGEQASARKAKKTGLEYSSRKLQRPTVFLS